MTPEARAAVVSLLAFAVAHRLASELERRLNIERQVERFSADLAEGLSRSGFWS